MSDPDHDRGAVESIPEQLRSEDPTFAQIAPASKTPVRGTSERDGPFYRATDGDLADHLADGGNVGRVFHDDLVAVDVDHPDLLEYLDDFPATFAVESGGEGFSRHRYYRCPGFEGGKIGLDDGDRNLGGILSGDCFALVPPSVHDETGDPYAVHADRPVAAVSADRIRDLVDELGGDELTIDYAAPTGTLGGVETDDFSITHFEESIEMEVRLWVKSGTAMVVRQRASTANGTVTYDVIDHLPAGDDPDVTTVRPSGSIEDLQGAAPFPIPTLPGNGEYEFERGGVAQFGPGSTAVLLYAGESAAAVVARTDVDVLPEEVADAPTESVDLDSRSVAAATTDDGSLVRWRSDGVETAAVGGRSREDLLSFVEGLGVE